MKNAIKAERRQLEVFAFGVWDIVKMKSVNVLMKIVPYIAGD